MGTARELKYNDEQLRGLVDGFIRYVRTKFSFSEMYVTASPCVLCSMKAYQVGIKEIVYLDPYTDIAPDLILCCGFNQPKLRPFMGAIGETFYKLYKPFLPYKDELAIWDRGVKKEKK